MRKNLVLVAAATTLLWVGQACATTIVIRATGQMQEGVDAIGLFAPAFTELAGDAYTLTYILDTTVGQHTVLPGGQGDFYLSGATHGGTVGVTATLTINGQSVTVVGSDNSGALDLEYLSQYQFSAYDGSNLLNLNVPVENTAAHPQPGLLDQPYSWNSSQTSICANNCANENFISGVHDTALQLDVRTLTIAEAPGVPEPATWTLMIAGFGLAGAGLRRRRAAPDLKTFQGS